MFQGIYPALVTPFRDEPGIQPAVDMDSLEALVEWQLDSGVHGIVACGTTAEAATLTHDEKIAVTKKIIEIVRGRVPVVVGTGTNDTRVTIELSKEAKKLGADGVLIVSPYYNKPTQEGLFQHFKSVAEQCGLPVILYNIPGRAVVEIAAETFARLSRVPGIVAVKQAVDSMEKLIQLSEAVEGRMKIFAGDCAITHLVMCMGGVGAISASANVIPREMVAIYEAARRGDLAAARDAQLLAYPMIKALFVETNPAPAKTALAMMKRIASDRMRLPMVPVSEKTRELLRREGEKLGMWRS